MDTDIRIDPEWACPTCNGTGRMYTLIGPTVKTAHAQPVPCGFCRGTGDQRQAPPEWLDCPSRNRAAYHESLR